MGMTAAAKRYIGESPLSAFTWFLVCLYFIGELVAVRSKKLNRTRRLRQLNTRKNQIQLESERRAQQEEEKARIKTDVKDVEVNDVEVRVRGQDPPKAQPKRFTLVDMVKNAVQNVKDTTKRKIKRAKKAKASKPDPELVSDKSKKKKKKKEKKKKEKKPIKEEKQKESGKSKTKS